MKKKKGKRLVSKFHQNQFVMHNRAVVGWRRYVTREIRYSSCRPRITISRTRCVKGEKKKNKTKKGEKRGGKLKETQKGTKSSRREKERRGQKCLHESHVCDIITRKRAACWSFFFFGWCTLAMNGCGRPASFRGKKYLFDNDGASFN